MVRSVKTVVVARQASLAGLWRHWEKGRLFLACRIIATQQNLSASNVSRSALSAATQTAQQNPITRTIAADMEAVNTVIRARLQSEVALVNQIAEYIISAGGKRIRRPVARHVSHRTSRRARRVLSETGLPFPRATAPPHQIGRASCRERV